MSYVEETFPEVNCTLEEDEFSLKSHFTERCYLTLALGPGILSERFELIENVTDEILVNRSVFSDRECSDFVDAGAFVRELNDCTSSFSSSYIGTLFGSATPAVTAFLASGLTCDELKENSFSSVLELIGEDGSANEDDHPFDAGQYCVPGPFLAEIDEVQVGSVLFSGRNLFAYNDTACQQTRLQSESVLNKCFDLNFTSFVEGEPVEVNTVFKFGGQRGADFVAPLTTLEIVLIVVGSIAGVALLALLCFCVVKKRKESKNNALKTSET